MEFSTAFWSATAAVASAVAAFLMWRTSLQSFRQSARPELVISGWSRKTSDLDNIDKINFTSIKNAGSGVALHVHMNSFMLADDNRPQAVMSTIRESVISPGQSITSVGEISIYWNNITGTPGSKYLSVGIELFCLDTTGVRYDTKYNLFIVQLGGNQYLQDEIANGVMLQTRSVSYKAVWYLKVISKVRKIQFLINNINNR